MRERHSKIIRSHDRGMRTDQLGRRRVRRGEDDEPFTVQEKELTVSVADPFGEYSFYTVGRELEFTCSARDGWTYPIKDSSPAEVRTEFAEHSQLVYHKKKPELMKVIIALVSDNARLPVRGGDPALDDLADDDFDTE